MEESLKSQFLRIWCMIVADGDIDQKELSLMYQIGEEYELSRAQVQDTILSGGNITTIPLNPLDKIRYLYDLSRMAWADNILHDKEKALLQDYAILFGFNKEMIAEFVDYLLDKAKAGVSFTELKEEFKEA